MSFTVRVVYLEPGSVAWAAYASVDAEHPIDFGVCADGDEADEVAEAEWKFAAQFPSDRVVVWDYRQ